jgi:RNA polymerase sigma factor (sigma-70 family)
VVIVTACHSQGVGSFACAQAGCPVCLEALMQAHAGLVHYLVRQQEIGGVEYQDLIQEGQIALWQSILHFDPGRGNTFSSYAWKAIHRRVWRSLAYADQSQGYVDVEEWLDLPGQAEAAWQQDQVRQAIEEELLCLPERLRQVIQLAYGLGEQPPHNLAEIGRLWGLTRERVRHLRNDALALLRLAAISLRLRGLCEQDSRPAYRQAQHLNRAWQRSRRGRR